MPRRKYKASAADKKGTPRSYRPSASDLSKGSPTRSSLGSRPKKKAKKIHKKTYNRRRSLEDASQVPQNAVTLFCDGCCFPTNPGKCGWAFAECESGDREFGFLAFGTNNQAELTSAIEAMRYVLVMGLHLTGKPVLVFSDSQYVVRGCMEWLPKWKRNGWKKTSESGSQLKNMDLWQQIAELLEQTNAKFRWVKGHNGNHWNELCDRLASEGASRQIRKFLPGKTKKQETLGCPEDDECFTMSSFSSDFLTTSSILF